jgi:DNA-binding NarL/FixJ family response regulator
MTRVLLATKEPILAKGLESILMAGGMEIAAVCHDVFELFECIERCRPDIAVLDMPVLPSPEVITDLQRLAPGCRLAPWPHLTLSESPTRLVDTLSLMAQFPGPDPSPSALVNLACSEGERELIALAGYGLNNREIADALGSNRSNVQKRLRNLADRLGAGDRYELALFGLSTLNETHQNERSV